MKNTRQNHNDRTGSSQDFSNNEGYERYEQDYSTRRALDDQDKTFNTSRLNFIDSQTANSAYGARIKVPIGKVTQSTTTATKSVQ